MEFTIRRAQTEDAQQMLQVYNSFTKQFIGSASRTTKNFRTTLRRKDNINWVALDSQNRVVGYISTRLEKTINRGEFKEIVVDAKHDFEKVAGILVEKGNAFFAEKKVSSIIAGSVRNPAYEKLFPKLGFFESESTDVFMYTILNVQKFLFELSPVFVSRLKQLQNWSGLVQIECEEYSLALEKKSASVQQIVWTNQTVDLKITLTRELLIKILFSLTDPVESCRTGLLKIRTSLGSQETNHLLNALFPKKQFLIMDYW